MAIDTTTPTIYPPTAEDMGDFAAGSSPSPAITPPVEPPTYETPEGAYPAGDMSSELGGFASEAMATPSRYDSDLIRDITGQIDADLEQQKLYAGTELDEFMSQRGMVGSSVEGELRKGMLGDFERQRMERVNELNKSAADAWAADRASAADIGFKSAEFERALGGDLVNEERWKAEFGQSQYEWERQYGSVTELQKRALDLQETGMEYEEAFRRAKMEVESGQFESEQERVKSEFAAELGEVQASRMQEYGIRKDEFDLAVKAQQDAADAEGRSLDIDEARNLAEQDIRLKQLEQEAKLAGESFDIDRERLKIQNEQFTQSMDQEQQVLEEARERRLGEMGIEEGRLANETLRIQQEAALSGRDLDLQQARDEAEITIRTADRVEQARQADQVITQDEARLLAEQDMFDDELKAKQSEFADRLGLEEDVYKEQVEARKAEYADRVAGRLAEMGLQEGSIASQVQERALDRHIEERALDLQEEGTDTEAAWRLAERELTERMDKERIRIQSEGITAEKAMNQARIQGEKDISAARNTMAKDVEALRNEGELNIATKRAKWDKEIEKLRIELGESQLLEQTEARKAQVTQLEAELTEQTEARKAYITQAGSELTEQTEARKAQFGELSKQRLSDEAIREEANAIQRTGINNERAMVEAARELEYDARDKDRGLKAWTTEEDLKQREREFRLASKDKRLDMIMSAVSSDLDATKLKDFIRNYGWDPLPATDDEGVVGPDGKKEKDETTTADEPPAGTPDWVIDAGWNKEWSFDTGNLKWYDDQGRPVPGPEEGDEFESA